MFGWLFQKARVQTKPDGNRDDLPWWRLYRRVAGDLMPEPVDGKPEFEHGADVRLIKRPDDVRKILRVEWHPFQHCYCYYIETSTSRAGQHCPAYWFAEQLRRA